MALFSGMFAMDTLNVCAAHGELISDVLGSAI